MLKKSNPLGSVPSPITMPDAVSDPPSQDASPNSKSDKPSFQKTKQKSLSELMDDPRQSMPSSRETEIGVLSCLLQSSDSELLGEAIENLPGPDCFYVPAHRIIFEGVMEMYNKSQPIDLISVVQLLQDRNQLDKVGGAAAVAEIFSYSPTAAHFSYYLHILTQKYVLRRIIQTCTDCITQAYEDQENVDGLLDEVEQRILAVRETRKAKAFATMKDEVMKAIAEIEDMYKNKGKTSGLSSGFAGLDEKTNGMKGGEMIVIAARPSMGKTAFALNMVEAVGIDQQKPVAVFSLEMPTAQLVFRLLCSRAGIEMSKLNGGFLSQNRDFPLLMSAAQTLANSPIFIDDSPGLSILEVRSKARRLKKQHDIQLIAIDYLQLLKSNSRRAQDNRQLEIAEISSGLKNIAKELNIPVIVLAQLNRGPESRGGKPRLSDLRESGAIEQDADLVGLLLREKYYAEDAEDAEEKAGKAVLDVAKNRNGPTGEVPLVFLEQNMRFVDRAFEEGEDGFGDQ
ncbi:MAG: replicative DNA helicase [Verrucomicrobiales bacterium]